MQQLNKFTELILAFCPPDKLIPRSPISVTKNKTNKITNKNNQNLKRLVQPKNKN